MPHFVRHGCLSCHPVAAVHVSLHLQDRLHLLPRGLCTQGGLAEVQQLCFILVSGNLEDAASPAIRAQRYPALQLHSLIAILPKFR